MRKLILPIFVLLLIGACSLPSSIDPRLDNTLTPFDGGELEPPDGALKAQIALAEELNISADDVSLRAIDSMEFDDSCLDAAQPGETCSGPAVSGYIVTLSVGADIYIYHTDLEGDNLRWVGGVVDPSPLSLKAVEQLAQLLDADSAIIKVIRETPANFSDACLEIIIPGLTCAPVVTRGLIIRLAADGHYYEYRGANDSDTPVLASLDNFSATTAVITWSRKSGQVDYCDDLLLYINGTVMHYGCTVDSGRTPGVYTLSLSEHQQLISLFLIGESFEFSQGQVSSGEQRLVFSGIGKRPFVPAEQLDIVRYAQGILEKQFLNNQATQPAIQSTP